MIDYAPIVIFTYNRYDHLKRVVECLKKNKEAALSQLYIFSDGNKDEEDRKEVNEVRRYLKTISGFSKVNINESEYNRGIEKQEIEGISEVINKHGKAIVIEDDIAVGNCFLEYMNDALCKYKEKKEVISITGYSFISDRKLDREYSFTQLTSAWGWATWKDRWKNIKEDFSSSDLDYIENNREKFNYGYCYYDMLMSQLENKRITWDVRWYVTSFLLGCVSLFPIKSMVNNIGMDGSGTHYQDKTQLNRIEDIDYPYSGNLPDSISEEEIIMQIIQEEISK